MSSDLQSALESLQLNNYVSRVFAHLALIFLSD